MFAPAITTGVTRACGPARNSASAASTTWCGCPNFHDRWTDDPDEHPIGWERVEGSAREIRRKRDQLIGSRGGRPPAKEALFTASILPSAAATILRSPPASTPSGAARR